MAKPLKKITKEIKDTQELNKTVKELSKKYGGAWTFTILPFTHTTTFYKFQSPSKVPDEFYDHSRNRIGYKGKLISFTPAAIIREQNRGITRD